MRMATKGQVVATLAFLLYGLSHFDVIEAGGKGPTGLFAASNGRHVIVADSSVPGLVLVDLLFGAAVERLSLKGKTAFQGASPVAVATCGECDYLFVTCNWGKYVAVYLTDTVDNLLSKHGRLGFGTVNDDHETNIEYDENIPVKIGSMQQNRTFGSDGRVVVADPEGKVLYMTDLKNSSVYAVRDIGTHKNKKLTTGRHKSQPQTLPKIRLLSSIGEKPMYPYGITWATDGNGARYLWVTTHAGRLIEIDRKDGKVKKTVDMNAIGCPRMEDKVNMRTAIEDPTMARGTGLLVLGNFPKTLEAALWRVHVNKEECEMIFGALRGHADWIDGVASLTTFTRPHNLAIHPDNSTLILSDTDNRALRLLDLTSGTSSSVMYNRDSLLRESKANKKSLLSCNDSRISENSFPSMSPLGTSSAVILPLSEKDAQLFSTYKEANERCESQGMRLCEPSELRRSRALFSLLSSEQASAIAASSWTSAECAGCLQMDVEVKCETGVFGDTSSGSQGGRNLALDESVLRSWHSGYAIEAVGGKGHGTSSSFESVTLCLGQSDGGDISAHALCCADC